MQVAKPTGWHSLYIQTYTNEGISEALTGILEFLGYQKYDPFPGGLGTPPGLKTFVKLFVAPQQDGWVRVLGEPDTRMLAELSREMAVLHAWLTNNDGSFDSGIDVYTNGSHSTDLTPFLRPGKSSDDLEKALQGALPIAPDPVDAAPTIITLPADVEQLAKSGNVDPQQANKLMNRLTGQLFGKMDRSSGGEASAMQDQARAMLAAGVNWNSPAGQKLRSLAEILMLPSNWRNPDFETVRAAYQVARRLLRTPSADLMPDEKAARQALPDAIEYKPVYMGRA